MIDDHLMGTRTVVGRPRGSISDNRHSTIVTRHLLWFLLLLPSLSSAQQVDWSRVHSLTIQGIDQLYVALPLEAVQEPAKPFPISARLEPADHALLLDSPVIRGPLGPIWVGKGVMDYWPLTWSSFWAVMSIITPIIRTGLDAAQCSFGSGGAHHGAEVAG